MATGKRRRTTAAVALSAAAHLVVLAVAALQAPTLRIRPDAETPPQTVIPVLILPGLPGRAAASASPPRLRRPSPRQAPSAQPMGPSEIAPAPALPAQPTAPVPDLAASLRRGPVGCANAGAVGLSRAERETCDERLAAGAASAPHLWGMEPAKRVYYQAVAEAKEPSGPPTPGTTARHLGPFDVDLRGIKGHMPFVACKIAFGPGKKPNLIPPHALRLGPCFIDPPAGSLSPDVDIPLP